MENIKIIITMRKEKGSEEFGDQMVLEILMSEAEKINEMMADKINILCTVVDTKKAKIYLTI